MSIEKKKYKSYYKSKKEKEYEASLAKPVIKLNHPTTYTPNLTARIHTSHTDKDGVVCNVYESIYINTQQ